MEGYNALSSKIIPVPACPIATRASGIFTNSYRALVDTNNIASLYEPRHTRVHYDVSSRPHEVNSAVDNTAIHNDVGNFKEMVKNATDLSGHKLKLDANCHCYPKQNGISMVGSHSGYYLLSGKFIKTKTSVTSLVKAREKIDIKRSNGLFMLSSEVFEVAIASPIWNGLNWVPEPSRWLCVSNFPFESEYYPVLRLLFEAYGDVREIYCDIKGIAYVFYYDIRDAIKAQNSLKHQVAPHNRGRLNVRFSQKPTNIDGLIQNEGSLIISYYDAYASEPTIKTQLNKYGTIKEFWSQVYDDVRVITLEYYDSRNANSAKKSLNGQKIQDAILIIEFHDPSAHSWDIITNEISGRQKPPKPAAKSYPELPATNTVHSSGNRTIPLRNYMNIEKVKQGLDVRTTFMIRNIPNKYTQEMLIAELNETHKGKYDFLYLRIDFANKCNVGYAFINFVEISTLLSFAELHVGRKWTWFNSNKICELSYANVQGYPALVDKFRTSSTMRERPEYRPKVFFTSGPMKGMEAPFPYYSGQK